MSSYMGKSGATLLFYLTQPFFFRIRAGYRLRFFGPWYFALGPLSLCVPDLVPPLLSGQIYLLLLLRTEIPYLFLTKFSSATMDRNRDRDMDHDCLDSLFFCYCSFPSLVAR